MDCDKRNFAWGLCRVCPVSDVDGGRSYVQHSSAWTDAGRRAECGSWGEQTASSSNLMGGDARAEKEIAKENRDRCC